MISYFNSRSGSHVTDPVCFQLQKEIETTVNFSLLDIELKKFSKSGWLVWSIGLHGYPDGPLNRSCTVLCSVARY